jgi:hypothetical protein
LCLAFPEPGASRFNHGAAVTAAAPRRARCTAPESAAGISENEQAADALAGHVDHAGHWCLAAIAVRLGRCAWQLAHLGQLASQLSIFAQLENYYQLAQMRQLNARLAGATFVAPDLKNPRPRFRRSRATRPGIMRPKDSRKRPHVGLARCGWWPWLICAATGRDQPQPLSVLISTRFGVVFCPSEFSSDRIAACMSAALR